MLTSKNCVYCVGGEELVDWIEWEEELPYIDERPRDGLIVLPSGDDNIQIKYCPWCGRKLGKNK